MLRSAYSRDSMQLPRYAYLRGISTIDLQQYDLFAKVELYICDCTLDYCLLFSG